MGPFVGSTTSGNVSVLPADDFIEEELIPHWAGMIVLPVKYIFMKRKAVCWWNEDLPEESIWCCAFMNFSGQEQRLSLPEGIRECSPDCELCV